MVDEPDAIWKPGYDGPPPIVRSATEPTTEPTTDRTTDQGAPARRHRPWAWRLGVAGGIALGLVVAAFIVLDPLDSRDESTADAEPEASVQPSRSEIEPPDPSVFGGPAARRLPEGAATLWSVDIPTDGDHWVEVIGRDLVIAAIEQPVATLVALDALTGAQRWTSGLTAHPRDVTVIGAVDDVLVLEQPGAIGPTVTGVDVATGETRWVADAAPNDGHVALIGTPFVARLPSAPDRFVSLIDASSGRDVGGIVSDPVATGRPGGWSTDGRGTWFVVDDGTVTAYDLTTELGEATVVGAVDDVLLPRLVVDDQLVSVDDTGSISVQGPAASAPVAVSEDVPEPVRSLTPVSDSNFVVTAPGSIAGVSVQGDTLDITWSRSEGAVVDEHPIEGGTVLQVATSGGAGMQLVDGRTGDTIEQLTMVPNALDALLVAGDGLVALRTSDLGTRLAGIDLDGAERWSIAGSAPVLVGDRIVVRSAGSSRQLRITAYGDVD